MDDSAGNNEAEALAWHKERRDEVQALREIKEQMSNHAIAGGSGGASGADSSPVPVYNTVNDSGAREEFDTGSVRDTQEGKGRYDLIPVGPLKRLARHYENGSRKYGDWNWSKGQPSSRYYSSAMRHLTAYMAGDRSEDHLAAVAWNAFSMMYNEETTPKMDNISNGEFFGK